jgi:hypothetical protein
MSCPDCSANLNETPVGEPCPRCGGGRRDASPSPATARAVASVPDPRVITTSDFDDGSTERTVGSRGFKTTTRTDASGTEQSFDGMPVRGEADVLQVCKVLRQALLAKGFELEKFRLPKDDRAADAVAETPNGEMEVQVVGVLPASIQAELGRTNSATSNASAAERAEQVCTAIEKKAGRYAPAVKAALVLALDSIRSPAHTLHDVVSELKSAVFSGRVANSGFKAVWLVGPLATDTHQLA